MLVSILATLAAPSPAVSAAASGWGSFRGAGNAGVGDGPAPARWDGRTGSNLAWKTPIPGRGHSSPVVAGGRVFLTTAVADPQPEYPQGLAVGLAPAVDEAVYSWRVVALELTSGEVAWSRTVHTGRPRSRRHPKNTFATPTAATDGRVVVAYFGSEGLHALTVAGEPLWSVDLGRVDTGAPGDRSLQWGVASSPVIWGDRVIVQLDGDDEPRLAAFALADGRALWSTPRADGPSWGSPALAVGEGGPLVVVNAPAAVRAYDPGDGGLVWSYRWGMDLVQSSPAVSGDTVFTAAGKGAAQPVLAIRSGAHGDLTDPGGADRQDDRQGSAGLLWKRDRGGPITPTVLAYRECLYALVDLGILRCFSVEDGELVYERRLPDTFLASPVAADGRVYLAAEAGDVYVIAAGAEFEALAVNPVGEPLVATPAIAGGKLLVRGTEHLFAFEQPVAAAPEPPRPAVEDG